MKRRIAILLTATLLASACSGAASPGPPCSLLALPGADAAVTKSLAGEGGGGGGSISGAGDRFGGLLSGWGAPVLIAFAGLLLIGALSSRNVGTAVGIVLVTLVGLIFLLSPQSIEATAKAIANVVF